MWQGYDRGSQRLDIASQSQQEETLADIEHISTIAGSLGSIGTITHSVDDHLYETDHTDLNSDYDEAELKRELMKDKWRQLFDLVSISFHFWLFFNIVTILFPKI